MTRPLFGSRGLWPGVSAGDSGRRVGGPPVRGRSATTYANGATRPRTIADDGDGYLLLTANDDGTVAPADYPSRMISVAWTLPARVNVGGARCGYGVLLRATLDTQPALGTAISISGSGSRTGTPASPGPPP